jgi:hypothetical protein
MDQTENNQTKLNLLKVFLLTIIILISGFVSFEIYEVNTATASIYSDPVTSIPSDVTGDHAPLSWQVYSDNVITFRYPKSVKIAPIGCPSGADTCISAVNISDPGQGLIFYEKASSLSAKVFATQSFSSGGVQIVTSNAKPINGFDTYTARTNRTFSGASYGYWETYIAHNGEVAYSSYLSNSLSAPIYRQVVSSLSLVY